MQRREFISEVLKHTFVGTTACSLSGCGTLFHAERNGQPHSNNIDWKIAALDGLGLLLFFVPGVIAFVVDFSTGAIYLPAEQSQTGYGRNAHIPFRTSTRDAHVAPKITSNTTLAIPSMVAPDQSVGAWKNLGLERVAIPRDQTRPNQIEAVVAEHIGQEISLDDSESRLSVLARIDQFDEQRTRHQIDRTFGHNVRSFFSQWKIS
jgi:hypothetical protein